MLQYRLSTLMIGMLVVAIGCCVMFSAPPFIAYIIMTLATLLIMPLVLAGVVYGRDGVRAFAIGCAPPVSIVFYSLLTYQSFFRGVSFISSAQGGNELEVRIFFGAFFLIVGMSGVTSLSVQSWCVWRRKRRDSPEERTENVTGETMECPTCGQMIPKLSNKHAADDVAGI